MTETSVYIAGVYEHPTRKAPEKTTLQLHAEVAKGALNDAGIAKDDIDAIFTAGQTERGGIISPQLISDYLMINASYTNTTDHGGSSYISHLGHAMNLIRSGKCDIALVTLAGRPRTGSLENSNAQPKNIYDDFVDIYGMPVVSRYAMAAHRHMDEYGTTAEQLAEVRVAASTHAQYNDDAMYQDPVSVEDVVESRMISDPLHLLDCCVISDGGGGLILASEHIRNKIQRKCIEILGHSESIKHQRGGYMDMTYTAAVDSGPGAFSEAGVNNSDIDYVSIYDSFTITVISTLEDLGFCDKGKGGEFVQDGTLKAPNGELPFNTDGGGLCNNHPDNRGGMTKIIEAVRQLRGEANPEVQVHNCNLALVHGTGGGGFNHHQGATSILGEAK